VKRVLSIGTLLSAITGLLVVVLVAAFAVSALSAYHREKQSRMLVSVVSGARDIMAPMIAVRAEVTLANLVLEAPQAAVPGTVAELRRLHARTDAALDIALREIAERPFFRRQVPSAVIASRARRIPCLVSPASLPPSSSRARNVVTFSTYGRRRPRSCRVNLRSNRQSWESICPAPTPPSII
jgi:hypothetical protein